jgi:hypothetical protein
MKRKTVFTAALLSAVAWSPLSSEPDDGGAISINTQIVSDYVFRGVSFLDGYYDQKKEAYGSFKSAFTLQPSITYETPLEGLTFNLWGSFAMTNREDVDSDGNFQLSPGGDDLLISSGIVSANGIAPNAGQLVAGIYDGVAAAKQAVGVSAYYGAFGYVGGDPGYYKEENGLKRADELDFTIAYEKETKAGTMTFGIVQYSFADLKAKGGASFYTEMFGKYSLPSIPEVTLALYSDIQTSNYYWNLSYGSSYELSESMSLDYAVGAGYTQKQNAQGMQDVTGSIGLTISDFNVGFNVAYRPDMKMIELNDPNTNLPLWLQGESTAGDGLVPDPSKNSGLVNTLINGMISARLPASTAFGPYTYTPRTALPKAIYWINFGYTTSL